MYRAPAAEDVAPVQRSADGRPPSKTVACLLAAFCGIGVGHYYAGLRRRALAWIGVTIACSLGADLLVLLFARGPAFGLALPVLVGSLMLAWLGPLVDLS